MKKDSQIVPVESNVSIQKVSRILILTDKLISGTSEKELILFDPVFYHEQDEIEKSIINFIISNFWYFINDIKKNYFGNGKETKIFDSALYDRIKMENQKSIEFPYVEHRTRGGGGFGYGVAGWGKMSDKERKQYHNRTSLMDDEILIMILTH